MRKAADQQCATKTMTARVYCLSHCVSVCVSRASCKPLDNFYQDDDLVLSVSAVFRAERSNMHSTSIASPVWFSSVNGMLKELTLGVESPRVRLSYETFTTSPISWLIATNLFRNTSVRTKQMLCSGLLLTWTLARSGKTSWKLKFRYLPTAVCCHLVGSWHVSQQLLLHQDQ